MMEELDALEEIDEAQVEVQAPQPSDANDEDDRSLEMSLSLRDVQALQRKQYELFCEMLHADQ